MNWTWGKVRGQKIHFACATPEESTLTWGLFGNENTPGVDDTCVRCGKPLDEVPDP